MSVPSLAEMSYERGNPQEFTSLIRDLAPVGDLTTNKTFDFEFVNVEKPFETYSGANVMLRSVWLLYWRLAISVLCKFLL